MECAFYTEYLGIPTDSHRQLYELANEYVSRTEEFDKSVCGKINGDGIAVPIDPLENRLIQENAKDILKELTLKANELGYSQKDLLQMIRQINRRS
ncbi:MAG: hypothetical protein WC119_08840 [Synergistaceae bacterium]